MINTPFNKNDWFSLKIIASDYEGQDAVIFVAGQLYKRNTQFLVEVLDLIEAYIDKFPANNPAYDVKFAKDTMPHTGYFMVSKNLEPSFFNGSKEQRKIAGIASFLNTLKYGVIKTDSADTHEQYYFAMQAVSHRIMNLMQLVTREIPSYASLIDVTSNSLVFSDKKFTYRYLYNLSVEHVSKNAIITDYSGYLTPYVSPSKEKTVGHVFIEEALEGYKCSHALLISDAGHQEAIIKGIVDIIGVMYRNNILGDFMNLHNYFYDPIKQKVYLTDTFSVYKSLKLSKGLLRASLINNYTMFSGEVGQIGRKFEQQFMQSDFWNSLSENLTGTENYSYFTYDEFHKNIIEPYVMELAKASENRPLLVRGYVSPEQKAYEERKKNKKGFFSWFK